MSIVEAELVLFETIRERGQQWVRARHRGGVKTSWHLVGQWSEEVRATILAELNQLVAPAI